MKYYCALDQNPNGILPGRHRAVVTDQPRLANPFQGRSKMTLCGHQPKVISPTYEPDKNLIQAINDDHHLALYHKWSGACVSYYKGQVKEFSFPIVTGKDTPWKRWAFSLTLNERSLREMVDV